MVSGNALLSAIVLWNNTQIEISFNILIFICKTALYFNIRNVIVIIVYVTVNETASDDFIY